MARIIIPDTIKNILSRLNEAGVAAYAVGGCVRDSLLGLTPEDWDIAAASSPEETMSLFGADALPTGLKHGTVTVKTPLCPVEITTYRTDGAYSDHRRPDSVKFVGSIEEDLARRDFTMNAIALSLSGSLLDPFGGVGDIADRLIRCVGEPSRRFEEDALRMFRALRFSSKLGFCIHPDTLAAIFEKAGLASSLAAERISSELVKLLPYGCAMPLDTLFSSGLMQRYARVAHGADFSRVELLPAEYEKRLSGMCAILQKSGAIDTRALLSALKFPTAVVKRCSDGVAAALSGLPGSAFAWRRLVYAIGREACLNACAAHFALCGEDLSPALGASLEGGACFSLKSLAVDGKALASLGYSGRELGAELERLLLHVMRHPEDNVRETLLAMARR